MASRILLEPGGTYHIFNHAVGYDDIFREDENYFFFLNKCSLRLTSFADVLAFCLMPNHFHFVLRIKDKGELMSLWNSKMMKLKSHSLRKGIPPLSEIYLLDDIITTQFANLFNSYVQAYNKKYFRQGSLLKESFQRKRIETMDQLIKTICYIHQNPVEHGFTVNCGDWKYSSFNALVGSAKTNVMRDEVLEMFGGKENFIFMHSRFAESEL